MRQRSALLSILLFAALSGAAAAADSRSPGWPANVTVFELQVAKVEVPKGSNSVHFQLPQLRIYDAKGQRVLNLTGYGSSFSGMLTSVLEGKGQPQASLLLARELDRLRTVDRKPLGALPKADFTIVEYWADWCLPCHAQARDMAAVLTEYPKVRVNLLHVDADLNKLHPERVEVEVLDVKDLDPAAVKKLSDPNLSEAERSRLLHDAAEAAAKKKKGQG
jgi:thiol-disulfide isomerase/thioredoxin